MNDYCSDVSFPQNWSWLGLGWDYDICMYFRICDRVYVDVLYAQNLKGSILNIQKVPVQSSFLTAQNRMFLQNFIWQKFSTIRKVKQTMVAISSCPSAAPWCWNCLSTFKRHGPVILANMPEPWSISWADWVLYKDDRYMFWKSWLRLRTGWFGL